MILLIAGSDILKSASKIHTVIVLLVPEVRERGVIYDLVIEAEWSQYVHRATNQFPHEYMVLDGKHIHLC